MLLPLLLVPLQLAAAADLLSARAWTGFSKLDGSLEFPELALPELRDKKNLGLAFSGGGVRAYTATLGYLRGLLDIGLLQQARYVSGVSGGSWAAAAYTFHDPSAEHTVSGAPVARNDSELLGVYVPPAALGFSELDEMPVRSAFHAATIGVGMTPLTGPEWVNKVQDVFLEPVGVPAIGNSSFTWNANTSAEICLRNPAEPLSLAVAGQREYGAPPYVIFGVTLMGPLDSTPLALDNRSYTVFDATPLYIGQARKEPVTFHGRKGEHPPIKDITLPVGGLLEPFAVGGKPPARALGPSSPASALLQVPAPPTKFALANAVAASSFFPGDVEGWLSRATAKELGLTLPFWAPADSGEQESPTVEAAVPRETLMLIGDGGLSENTDMTSLLRRRVPRIVMFETTDTTLNSDWNPLTHPNPTTNDIDDEFSAFFGLVSAKGLCYCWRRYCCCCYAHSHVCVCVCVCVCAVAVCCFVHMAFASCHVLITAVQWRRQFPHGLGPPS